MKRTDLRPILSLVLLAGANSADADTLYGRLGEQTWQHGFAGYVQILTGGYSSDGLSDEIDGNERISSLEGKATRQETGFLAPLWQVNYNFSQSRTRLFLGTPEYSVMDNDLAIEAGASHEFGDGTVLWAAYVPGLSKYRNEIWQDPYRTGRDRKRTETESKAFRLGADYLLGGPLSLVFESGKLSIDKDHAGESLRSRLSPAEIERLRRSGKFRRVGASLTLPLSHHFFLIPDISYTEMDADGEANSYDAISGGLVAAYINGPVEVFVHGQYGREQYDQPNPVFNAKRKDKNFGVTAGVSYMEPFGWKNVQADLVTGFSSRDSNISFYQSDSILLAAGFTWRY